MHRLIIAGSRTFENYELLNKTLTPFIGNIEEIVSGTARGADRLGEQFAREHNIRIKQFPADWNNLGKSAGYIRNEQMARYATACIVFWDGESKGTKHMINLAKQYKLKLKIVIV